MNDAGRGNRGCLLIGAAFVLLLVILGALGLSALLGLWSDEPPPVAEQTAPNPDPTSAPPGPSTAAACRDDAAAFRAYARPKLGSQVALLERVTAVCWEPAGRLRVEIEYAADVNATSAPMTSLCTTLSGFITEADRPWKGFTVYSTHTFTPGRPLLAGSTPDGKCVNPSQRG